MRHLMGVVIKKLADGIQLRPYVGNEEYSGIFRRVEMVVVLCNLMSKATIL